MADVTWLGKPGGQDAGAAHGSLYGLGAEGDSVVMNASLFIRIRTCARGVSLALVLAFLLPIFLAAVPGPALSAPAKLEQALADNRCAPAGGKSPLASHAHEDCCILCATGLAPVGEGKLLGGISLPQPTQTRTAAFAQVIHAPPAEAWFASALSSRGPPQHT